MSGTKKISMAMLANDYECPEELKQADDNYKNIDEVMGKEIEIMAFVFITSTNLDKYNQGNEVGVHFMYKSGDEIARTSSHAKKIVKAFQALESAYGKNVLDVPLPTKIIKKATSNGRMMYDFEF